MDTNVIINHQIKTLPVLGNTGTRIKLERQVICVYHNQVENVHISCHLRISNFKGSFR